VDGLEHRLDRLRLALRLQEQRRALTLRAQDAALPLGLRLEDRGLLLALAERIADAFCPSAVVIADCRAPRPSG
jgi:hypothetical protein